MEWAIAVLVVAVLGVAAVVAAGGIGEMNKEPVRDAYRQDLPEAALDAEDIRQLRFGVALRGYAMDQVDDVLARLGNEIAERDELIARLSNGRTAGSDQPTTQPGGPSIARADAGEVAL